MSYPYHGRVVEALVLVGGVDVLPPGGSASHSFTLTRGGFFILWCKGAGPGVTLSYTGPDGGGTISNGYGGDSQYFPLLLKAGRYTLTATSSRTAPALIDWDLLLPNGLGQSAAQASPFFGAASTAPAALTVIVPATNPATSGNPAPAAAPPGPGSGQAAAFPTGPVAGSLAAVSGLLSDQAPVGRPDADADPVAVTGPAAPGGSIALASLGQGLPPLGAFGQRGAPRHEENVANPRDGAMAAASDRDDAAADEAVLAADRSIGRMLALFMSAARPSSHEARDPSPEGAPRDLPAYAMGQDAEGTSEVGRDDEPESRRPAWLLPAAAVALGYHLAAARRARPTGRARKVPRNGADPRRGPDRFVPRFDLPESQQPVASVPHARPGAVVFHARVPGFM